MYNQKSHVLQGHNHLLYLWTLATATDILWSKENHTENSKRENAKEKAESVKTKQSVKTNFFEALPWLKSKNFDLTKVVYIYEDHAQQFVEFGDFSMI